MSTSLPRLPLSPIAPAPSDMPWMVVLGTLTVFDDGWVEFTTPEGRFVTQAVNARILPTVQNAVYSSEWDPPGKVSTAIISQRLEVQFTCEEAALAARVPDT